MHYFEKNVVEIKQEYTIFLINILSPIIYEGIKGIYNSSIELDNKFKKAILDDPNANNPGVLKIFQYYLKDIQVLNNHMINKEYERIKSKSKCADFFDDLIKAVIKSNIVLLTYNVSEKKCKIINDKYHESVNIELFIHNCYIECARIFFNYPEIFYHGFSNIDIQRNQREALQLIKDGINEAIRKMLPMKLILEEFLKKDYVPDDNDITKDMSDSQYINMRNLLKNKKIMEENDYYEEEYDGDYDGDKYDEYYDDNVFKKYNEGINDIDENIGISHPTKISILPAGVNPADHPTIPIGNSQIGVTNQIENTLLQKANDKNQVPEKNESENIQIKEIYKDNHGTGFTEKIEELILNNDVTNGTETAAGDILSKPMDNTEQSKKTNATNNVMKILESIKKPKNDFAEMVNKINKTQNKDVLSEVNIKIDKKLDTTH